MSGFLGSDVHPGFGHAGRRLVAECEEFKLFEIGRPGGRLVVERSESVEKAYWRSALRLADTDKGTSIDERIAWGIALVKLAEYTSLNAPHLPPPSASGKPFETEDLENLGGSTPMMARLASTIGVKLCEILAAPNPTIAIEDVAAQFRNAVRAFAAREWALPDTRSTKTLPFEAAMIIHAGAHFMHQRARPRKSEIRKELESVGFVRKGKNVEAHWIDAFNRAALQNLPE